MPTILSAITASASALDAEPARMEVAVSNLANADSTRASNEPYRRGSGPVSGENLEARDALVMGHLGLVKAIANRLARRLPPQVEVSELIGVGVLGLIDAAGRYRPSLGVPFDAFARCRIHGAMLDALRGLDWAPRAVRKMRRDVDGAIARLRHTLKREPETAEVARAMNISEEQYDRMLQQLRSADLATIRHGREDDGGANPLDLAFGRDEDGPHARLERRELVQLLARALGEVPARERHILSLYYEHELTLAEIGKVIGVGESRGSQLRTQAIARLRSRMTELLACRRSSSEQDPVAGRDRRAAALSDRPHRTAPRSATFRMRRGAMTSGI